MMISTLSRLQSLHYFLRSNFAPLMKTKIPSILLSLPSSSQPLSISSSPSSSSAFIHLPVYDMCLLKTFPLMCSHLWMKIFETRTPIFFVVVVCLIASLQLPYSLQYRHTFSSFHILHSSMTHSSVLSLWYYYLLCLFFSIRCLLSCMYPIIAIIFFPS